MATSFQYVLQEVPSFLIPKHKYAYCNVKNILLRDRLLNLIVKRLIYFAVYVR